MQNSINLIYNDTLSGFIKRCKSLIKRSGCLIITTLVFSAVTNAQELPLNLKVIDPYIELHSGPGAGYPTFYTIEQGEDVTVLTRRTGWYEVKAQNGKIGWAVASQVARTLLPTGEPVDLPSVSYGDYLKNSWRAGFKMGRFNDGGLEGSDVFSFSLGYRPLSWLGMEIEDGKIYKSEIKGNFQAINLLFEPFSQWKVSPVLTVGTGRIEIESQPELTPLEFDKESFTSFGLSANYYLGRNFVLKAGYQSYIVSTNTDNERLAQWNIGFNAFF